MTRENWKRGSRLAAVVVLLLAVVGTVAPVPAQTGGSKKCGWEADCYICYATLYQDNCTCWYGAYACTNGDQGDWGRCYC